MTMAGGSRRFRRAGTLVAALLLAAGIYFLARADDNEANGALLLLVVPIGLVAAQFGPALGMLAAAGSLGLFAAWVDAHGAGVGPIGYLTRTVVFFGFAGAIGLLADRPPSLFARGPKGGVATTPPRPFEGLAAGEQLTPRELEVIELLARGATNAQIAERFVISEQTVKSHVKHILTKLEVGNRTEAALRYVELYGSQSHLDSVETPGVPAAGATREQAARVAGFSPGGSVLLTLDDGSSLEVPLLEGLRNRFEPGDQALVYFDSKGALVGWYLPDAGIGVDMQDGRPRRKA
jgi:DNA-binding CsgD family transcriptional regulator